MEPSVGLAWLLLLLFGAAVAFESNPVGRTIKKYLIAPVLRTVNKLFWGSLKYIRRETLALLAWLGYEGRRLLVVIVAFFLVVFTFRTFGQSVGVKMAIVLFLFALTTRKRRVAKNSKLLREINGRLDVVGQEMGREVRAALKNNVPSRGDVQAAYADHRQRRNIYRNGGLDPDTGYAVDMPMHRPPSAWDLFRDVRRKKGER